MTVTDEQADQAASAPTPSTGTPTQPTASAWLTARAAVTEVLRPVIRPPQREPQPAGGVPRFAHVPAEPHPRAPRDTRWWAGAVLLAVSLLLVAFVVQATLLSGLQHERAQQILYDQLRQDLAEGTAPTGQLDYVTEEMVPLGQPVALLEIPSLGLREVVLQGSDSEVLRSGVGHRRDSVMPGQAGTAVLLGRQLAYGGPFSGLVRLQPGDEIRVTTAQGEHSYRVLGLRRAGDPMPAALRSGDGRLELQTADGLALFPSGVLYVDAALISESQQKPSTVMAYPALPLEERAMGQLENGWYPVFFGLCVLVAAGIGTIWLWRRWGRPHAWLVAFPVLLAIGVVVADTAMDALPNLL
ncbi:MAG: sortase [Leifsonia xyli]|nr:MAG: sortase [Leifsonia xyli]